MLGRTLVASTIVLLGASCSGREYDNTGSTLPQHPDAIGREMSVRPPVVTSGSPESPSAPSGGGVDAKITPSLIPSVTTAKAKYTVGPGGDYSSLSAVAGVLKPGDVVDVLGDASYMGGVHFTQDGTASQKIVIRGVPRNGKRPVVSGGNDGIEAAGSHYVFEGLEITGATNRCFFQHGDDVTLRDSLVRDCPGMGILGADRDSGSFTMEYVEVRKTGANGPTTSGRQRHQVYMATDERGHPHSTFRMQFCWIHDGAGGNNVKSRAERNEIYSNWIEGAVYHEIELIGPDGEDPDRAREDSDVVGNVFVKTTDFYAARVGGDGTGDTKGRYRFVNNTFVMGGKKAAIRFMDGVESLEATNNVFVQKGGGAVTLFSLEDAKWASGHPILAGAANWVPTGTSTPKEWSGSIVGDDPKLDQSFHLAAGSPLKGKGSSKTMLLDKNPVDKALPLPLFEPQRAIAPSIGRKKAPTPSIGAFEG